MTEFGSGDLPPAWIVVARIGDRVSLDRAGTGVDLKRSRRRNRRFYISVSAFEFNEKP